MNRKIKTITFRLAFVAFLLSFAAFHAAGAETAKKETVKTMVRGYVYDENYEVIDSVRVSIWQEDTLRVPMSIMSLKHADDIAASPDIKLLFEAEVGKKYTVHFDKDGYESCEKEIKVSNKKDQIKYAGWHQMKKATVTELNEVVVKATKVKMVMKGDTVVFDASAFKLPDGSMLEQLVRQLPGMNIDEEGVITYNGRKLNELLLNGKDFFKGDPKVALKNLPSYTVKNVKVYDRAAKDAYITGSNQRISDDENSQNLVLDVNLKKEYLKTKMANVEAGYGTNDRYRARIFGMGTGDELRLSFYGNANNLGDDSRADLSGTFRGGWDQPGFRNIQSGGIDYQFDSKKEVFEANGSLNVKRAESHTSEIGNSTQFFPSKDLYSRGRSDNRNTSLTIDTRHELNFKKETVYFSVNPYFSWAHGSGRNWSARATFNEFIPESYRGEVLDSVLADVPEYNRALLTRLHSISRSLSDSYTYGLRTYGTVSPRSWRGRLSIAANGEYRHGSTDSRDITDQGYGQANTSAGSAVKSDRYLPGHTNSSDISVRVGYNQKSTHFGERYSRTTGFGGGIGYQHVANDEAKKLFFSDELPDLSILPSVSMPAHALLDIANTFDSDQKKDIASANAGFYMNVEPTQQSDNGFNPSFSFSAYLDYSHNENSLIYHKPEKARQKVSYSSDHLQPQIQLSFQSANKKRNSSIFLLYNPYFSDPSLLYMLDDRASSDPLEVYVSAKGSLKKSLTHSAYLSFTNYTRGASSRIFRMYFNFSATRNAIANARTYNEMTGVTINTPMNINGNWNGRGKLSYDFSFGKDNCFETNFTFSSSLNHSVDFLTLESTPQRSTVMNWEYAPSFRLIYKFKNGSTISGGYRWRSVQQSSRLNAFNDRHYYGHKPWIATTIKLPADLTLQTQLILKMDRGFENKAMNVDQWLWNASLNKSFLKGAMTAKLEAVDLLNSVKEVTTTVNAQGRYETIQAMIPRYVMLTLSYNFNTAKPKR